MILARVISSGILLCLLSLGLSEDVQDQDEVKQWVLKLPQGQERAKRFAEENELNFLGEVVPETNLFYFSLRDHIRAKRSIDLHNFFSNHPDVAGIHPQNLLLKRFHRAPVDFEEELLLAPNGKIFQDSDQDVFQKRASAYVTDEDEFTEGCKSSNLSFPYYDPDEKLLEHLSKLQNKFNDSAWPFMWFLNKDVEGSPNGLDMNVGEAWSMGYTGKGVVVTIIDDGLEEEHPDLASNYDFIASKDLNDGHEHPTPRYDDFNTNKHGTRCAGTVAASANNGVCGVGIAYEAKVGGIRLLDGDMNDALEAMALSHERSYVSIYSASWGPEDNGQSVEGPAELATIALREGVEKGREGKGSIFVWASGNGGKFNDSCNCDGYASSIYTISVSSVSESGSRPWYVESCSSTITSTYSSGSKFNKDGVENKIITTDICGRCTNQGTGTSASSPMAAGIVALALQANPNLTWRDVQHLVVRTSRPKKNLKTVDWRTNKAGLTYSHSYGFGLMDAGALVKASLHWKTVPSQENCTVFSSNGSNPPIPPASVDSYAIDASPCDQINFIEHIQVSISLESSSRRGDLSVILRSPSGTFSTLLSERPFDEARAGFEVFEKWPFMTVHYWGEKVSPGNGTWQVLISNAGDKTALFKQWNVTFFGTRTDPQPGNPIQPLGPEKEPEATAMNKPVKVDVEPKVEIKDPTEPSDGIDDHTEPLDGIDDHTEPLDGIDDHTEPSDGINDHTEPLDGIQDKEDTTTSDEHVVQRVILNVDTSNK